MSREKYANRYLECVLTEDELKDCSKRLAVSVRDRSRAEDALKSFKSQNKSEIDGYDATINSMSEKVSSGKEYREVKCNVVYQWEDKVKEYVREDTGEIIDTDIITERELQEEAELNAPEKK